MKLRLPVENIIVKLFVKHTHLAILNSMTCMTVLYKQCRFNLSKAIQSVAPMGILSHTMLQNGCISN